MLYMVMGRSAPRRAHRLPKYINDTRNLRVGLMGGSFNPPHDGHFKIASSAIKYLGLDEVWWLISPQNPFKTSHQTLPFMERHQLCIKSAKHPKFRVLNIEDRLKTKNSFSLIKRMLPRFPNMKFVWIMGADNLYEFGKWYKANELSHLIPFAVFNRKNYSFKSLNSKGAFILRSRVQNNMLRKLIKQKPPKWGYLHNVNVNISSTEIRESK